jgi:hypothetical protein
VPDKENVIVSNIKKPKVSKNNGVAAKPGLIKTKTTQKPVIISDLVTVNSQKQKSIVDDNKTNEDIKANTQTEVEKEEVKQTEVNPLETKIDSVNREIVGTEGAVVKTKDTVAKDVLTSDSAKLVIEKKPSARKWKWGLHLTPGISSLNDQGFSIGSNKSLDVYNYQNPVGGSTGLPPARQQPSDARPGFALQAGVFAQRQLSPRTSFSLGLQYGYYSNVIHVGNRRDSLTGNSQLSNVMDDKANGVYNAGGDTIKYTNRYHFIEFPLIFQWQLNKNKAKPFTWSAGFTIGQLIATNAIMYDTAFNGIYYSNKSQLNKTQFSLSTGFSWTLANNKRAQWSLGPVANIHLNRLLDNPFENKKYLFFVGLRAGILFNSKK